MESLLTKYRPKSLSDILGQDRVIAGLGLFLRDPYPIGFIFHGDSGVGKTATAQVLARELGCAVDETELGGLHEIRAGEMKVDRVEQVLDLLRLRPLFGSGWKVLICNEADRMALPTETIWLDALEKLPPRTVVVFTTNCVEKLSRRFRDRCEVYSFTSDSAELQPHIRALAQKVWEGEGLTGEVPGIEDLGMPTLGSLEDLHASFRLALQQLNRLVREAKAGADIEATREQLARDNLASSAKVEADCDHCGKTQKVKANKKSHVCERCGKRFTLQLV